jgi:hypothetical protein
MRIFPKYWLPLLIWAGVIFIGSTKNAGSITQSRLVDAR